MSVLELNSRHSHVALPSVDKDNAFQVDFSEILDNEKVSRVE